MKRALINTLLLATASAGELLDWPAESRDRWESVAVTKLPSGVRPRDPEDPERALTTVQVRRADVDGDGVTDLVVDTARGGTGGSYVIIYRRDGKGYREVLSEQGGIIISNERGRVECWSRAGGLEYRRTVYRFDGRRFVELFTDSLKARPSDDRLEVVERRRPTTSE